MTIDQTRTSRACRTIGVTVSSGNFNELEHVNSIDTHSRCSELSVPWYADNLPSLLFVLQEVLAASSFCKVGKNCWCITAVDDCTFVQNSLQAVSVDACFRIKSSKISGSVCLGAVRAEGVAIKNLLAVRLGLTLQIAPFLRFGANSCFFPSGLRQ